MEKNGFEIKRVFDLYNVIEYKNFGKSFAPMIALNNQLVIAPDILAIHKETGWKCWVDCKWKRNPGWRTTRNQWEQGIDYYNASQYAEVDLQTNIPVYIMLQEATSPVDEYKDSKLTRQNQWLLISVSLISAIHSHEPCWPSKIDRGRMGQGGALWPRLAMKKITFDKNLINSFTDDPGEMHTIS